MKYLNDRHPDRDPHSSLPLQAATRRRSVAPRVTRSLLVIVAVGGCGGEKTIVEASGDAGAAASTSGVTYAASTTGASGSTSSAPSSGSSSTGVSGGAPCGSVTCASSQVCCIVTAPGTNTFQCVAAASCANPIGTSSGSTSSSSGSGGPGTGSIACGTVTCTAPNVCCTGGGGGAGNACRTQTACDASGNDVYTCSGSANCPNGQVCCVSFGASPGGGDLAQCAATCGARRTQQVCQPTDTCPNGTTCMRGGGAAFSTCQ